MTTTLSREAIRKLPPATRKRLIELTTPRVVEPYIAHIPHPKQQVFLSLNVREAMYGGAAGGGKSDAVLMAALQYVDVPGYSALILRRTWPDLNAPGAILDRARTWLANTDAQQKDGGRLWVFPSGAKLTFGYLQHDKDKYKFQSAEYQYIGFDELTHFEEGQYLYLFSRLRRPELVCLNCSTSVRRNDDGYRHTSAKMEKKCKDIFPDPKVIEQYQPSHDGLSVFDIPLRMRSATNPGGVGNDWVRSRFIDKETREPKSVFVPAKLNDNPSLDRASYRESLSHLSEVDRMRLEEGDWDIAETGDMFSRTNFKFIEKGRHIDRHTDVVRAWDMAGTEGGGDWTATVLLAKHEDGTYEVLDVQRVQYAGAKLEAFVKNTAVADGRSVHIVMEQEPGSAGKNIVDHYARNVLNGFGFSSQRPTGSKTDRAYPVQVASERGLIAIKPNDTTRDFLNELERFPEGANDDMVDALSLAFEYVNFGSRSRLIV